MGVPLVIIPSNGIFPYEPSSYGGTPMTMGKPQISYWLYHLGPL